MQYDSEMCWLFLGSNTIVTKPFTKKRQVHYVTLWNEVLINKFLKKTKTEWLFSVPILNNKHFNSDSNKTSWPYMQF